MADASPDTLEIEELAPTDLDVLEPLWTALHDHHSRITPVLGHAEARDREAAWRKRRSKYELWFEDPRAFALVARRGETPVGYAFVTVNPGFASWASGEDVAELETLSVVPEERNGGVGTALVDAVENRLRATGITEMTITSAVTNIDSHRFYERRGLTKAFVVFFGSFDRDSDGDSSP